MKLTKGFIIALVLINVLVTWRFIKTSDTLDATAQYANFRFSTDLVEYLYQTELKLVGSSYQEPEVFKQSYMRSLNILSSMDFLYAKKMEEAISGHVLQVQKLKKLNHEEFVYNLAIIYPTSYAIYKSGLTTTAKKEGLKIKLDNFQSTYVEANDRLFAFHSKNKTFVGLKITIRKLNGDILFSANTKDLDTEEKRANIVQLLDKYMSSKKGSITDSMWVVELS